MVNKMRIIKLLLSIILVLIFCPTFVFAGTCGSSANGGSTHCTGASPWASDTSDYVDVNYCVNTCATYGNTVTIPAGTSDWSIELVIEKYMTIQGNGIDSTIITNSGIDSTLKGIMRFTPDATSRAADGLMRFTGLTLKNTGGNLSTDSSKGILLEQFALLPTEALTLDQQKNVFVLPCSNAQLLAMALPGGKLPALNNDEWLTSCREACAKAAAAPVIEGDVIAGDAAAQKSVPFADAYDLAKVETIKGSITTIGSVRVGDQNEARVRLRVRTEAGREVIVYAAPVTYEDQKALGLRQGTKLEVTGSPAQYGTQTVLVAGSIAVDGKSARLRDDKGHVTWTRK